jgi:hypothetical protein
VEGENIAKTMNAGNKDLIQKNNTEVKHGRRMSERLKRDGGIRIEENNRRMAVKKGILKVILMSMLIIFHAYLLQILCCYLGKWESIWMISILILPI